VTVGEEDVSAAKPEVRRKKLKRQVCAILCGWALLVAPAHSFAASQDGAASEIVWKANFLAKSAAFIDWPVDSPMRTANTFRWCVYGTFTFGTTLVEKTRDLTIEGKRSEVKWIKKESELAGCQIIFVTRSEEKNYAKVLDAARTGRGLTVGETANFLDAGGMVALFTEGTAPAFEVNLEAVDAAKLKLSSRMLALARRVVNHTMAAKS
jgi:hypothetical protein